MKILVGEDDQAISEVVKIILEGEGHQVISATDAKQFQSSLSQKPQLILLDIALGGADGGKITQKLKKDSSFQSIPLIIMSANTNTEKIANDSGADGFLLKPFEMDQLLAVVKSYA